MGLSEGSRGEGRVEEKEERGGGWRRGEGELLGGVRFWRMREVLWRAAGRVVVIREVVVASTGRERRDTWVSGGERERTDMHGARAARRGNAGERNGGKGKERAHAEHLAEKGDGGIYCMKYLSQ